MRSWGPVTTTSEDWVTIGSHIDIDRPSRKRFTDTNWRDRNSDLDDCAVWVAMQLGNCCGVTGVQ